MSGTGAFRVFVALHMVDYTSRHLMHFSNVINQAGQSVDGVNAKLKLMGGLAGVMIGGAVVGAMASLVKHSVEASTELDNVERKLKSIGGINLDVFKKVSKQGWGLGNQFTASTQAERLQTFGDLHTVFGDSETAQKMWPMAMKFQMAMRSVNPETGNKQFFAAFKAAELSTPTKGGHIASPEAFQNRLEMFSKIYAGTMGRVTPSDMLAFTKQAKYLRFNLTDDAYYKAAALMYEQGGSVTGSAYQALGRIAGGRLGNASAGAKYSSEWERLGLLNNITERSKQGNPTRFDVVGRNLLLTDPNRWAEEVFAPAMAKRGFSLDKKPEFIAQLVRMFGNQTAGNAIFTILQQQGIIHKDAAVAKNSKGIDELSEAYKNRYAGSFASLRESLEDLSATIGKALKPVIIPALQSLTGAVRTVSEFVKEHPRIAAGVIVLTTAVGGLLMVLCGAGVVAALLSATAAGSALIGAVGGIAAACGPAIVFLGALVGAIVAVTNAVSGAIVHFRGGGKMPWVNQSSDAFAASQKFKGMLGLPAADGYTNGAFKLPNMTNSGNKVAVTNHININEAKDGLATVKDVLKNAVNPTSGFTHTSSFNARNGYGFGYG